MRVDLVLCMFPYIQIDELRPRLSICDLEVTDGPLRPQLVNLLKGIINAPAYAGRSGSLYVPLYRLMS